MDPHERLLGDIPGEVRVFHDAERQGVNLPLVADDERAERGGITGLGLRDQREVVSFHRLDGCSRAEIQADRRNLAHPAGRARTRAVCVRPRE